MFELTSLSSPMMALIFAWLVIDFELIKIKLNKKIIYWFSASVLFLVYGILFFNRITSQNAFEYFNNSVITYLSIFMLIIFQMVSNLVFKAKKDLFLYSSIALFISLGIISSNIINSMLISYILLMLSNCKEEKNKSSSWIVNFTYLVIVSILALIFFQLSTMGKFQEFFEVLEHSKKILPTVVWLLFLMLPCTAIYLIIKFHKNDIESWNAFLIKKIFWVVSCILATSAWMFQTKPYLSIYENTNVLNIAFGIYFLLSFVLLLYGLFKNRLAELFYSYFFFVYGVNFCLISYQQNLNSWTISILQMIFGISILSYLICRSGVVPSEKMSEVLVKISNTSNSNKLFICGALFLINPSLLPSHANKLIKIFEWNNFKNLAFSFQFYKLYPMLVFIVSIILFYFLINGISFKNKQPAHLNSKEKGETTSKVVFALIVLGFLSPYLYKYMSQFNN